MSFSLALSACSNPWVPDPIQHPDRAIYFRPNKPSPLTYGNYCGLGMKSGDLALPPVDAVDAACLEHDACFIEGRNRCDCNRELVAATDAILSDSTTPPPVRRRALGLRKFFTTAGPLCALFPYGATPPRQRDILATRYRPHGLKP